MMATILTLVVLTTVGAVAFPAVYLAAFRWPTTRAGRAAVVLGISLAIILTLTAVGAVFGVQYPPWIALVAYLLLCGGVWWQLLTLVSYVRRRRVASRPHEPPERAVTQPGAP